MPSISFFTACDANCLIKGKISSYILQSFHKMVAKKIIKFEEIQ